MSDENEFAVLGLTEDNDNMADDETNFFVSSANVPKSNNWANTLIGDISEAFDKVTNKLSVISSEIKDMKNKVLRSVSQVAKTANAAKTQADKNMVDIIDLKRHMQSLERECVILRDENKTLKGNTESLELYSRKDNLVATGIKDTPNETDQQCRDALHLFFQSQLGIRKEAAIQIQFVRCHRLGTYEHGKCRPVIMRFYKYDERQMVWGQCKNLRGKWPYTLSEDFPKSMASRRRLLYPIFKLAKDSKKYQTVSLRQDKLYLNRTQYTVDNLHTLPKHINPKTLSCKQDDHAYVTGGIYSHYNELSNWHTCDLEFHGRQYTTLESCWQHTKAMKAGDHVTAHKIFHATDPSTAKQLGREVVMNDQQKQRWDAGRSDLMTAMVRAKVNQNESVATVLRETGTKKLGESGIHDNFYTIGMKLTDNNVLNHKLWKHGNLMGKVLETIRSEL